MNKTILAILIAFMSISGLTLAQENANVDNDFLLIEEFGLRVYRPSKDRATLGIVRNINTFHILVRCVYQANGEYGAVTQWMEVLAPDQERKCTINNDGAFYVYTATPKKRHEGLKYISPVENHEKREPNYFIGFFRVNQKHKEPEGDVSIKNGAKGKW